MFYHKNAPFYEPQLINYDADTKTYKYKLMMKKTNEFKYFTCINDQKERKRCGYLFSMSKRGDLTLTKQHIKRFIKCGLIYNFNTNTKLIDIFTIKRKKKYTEIEEKEKAKVRRLLRYRKKTNKPVIDEYLIKRANFYNLKIPVIMAK